MKRKKEPIKRKLEWMGSLQTNLINCKNNKLHLFVSHGMFLLYVEPNSPINQRTPSRSQFAFV